MSDYCRYCEVQTWGRRKERRHDAGSNIGHLGRSQGSVWVKARYGKSLGDGRTRVERLKAGERGRPDGEKEEEVIRNTKREYNTT